MSVLNEARLGAIYSEHLKAFIADEVAKQTTPTPKSTETPPPVVNLSALFASLEPQQADSKSHEQKANDRLYIDLHIIDDDIALDEFGCASEIDGRASIAQDIKHMIRETGLLVGIIGQRDWERRRLNLNIIERHIDDDIRIIPSTARVTEQSIERYWITADTVEFGQVEVFL